jgi:hypothetical protein
MKKTGSKYPNRRHKGINTQYRFDDEESNRNLCKYITLLAEWSDGSIGYCPWHAKQQLTSEVNYENH